MFVRGFAAIAILTLAGLGSARAQDYATPAEAQAMAERAAAFLELEGPDIAFDAFTNGEDWHDRDLYVFVFDPAGVSVAHGGNPDLVGQDLTELTDINGFLFVQAFLAVEDTGWVDYVWANPVTGHEEPKTSYIIRVGDYVLGVGAYLPDATRATLDEAQAMAVAAADYLREVGPEIAYEAFTYGDEWRDRDLYVFVIDSDGVNRAQGADPSLVGTNEWGVTDPNGVLIVQEMLKIEDSGWVDYVWPDPLTGMDEPKRSFIIRVDDVVVGVGAYLAAG